MSPAISATALSGTAPDPAAADSASADPALAATRAWLEKAVIGLNLCPFAKAVHGKGQIRWVLSAAQDTDALLAELGAELEHLAEADPAVLDTTLIVHPQVLTDFLDYNDFLDLADATLEALELDGVLQVASFHPQYQFDGTAPGDMGNFSNRAPYPTLHLLREDSVARAVEAFPDAEQIYQRNIDTLDALGAAGWQRLLAGDAGAAADGDIAGDAACNAAPNAAPNAVPNAAPNADSDAASDAASNAALNAASHPARMATGHAATDAGTDTATAASNTRGPRP